MWLRSSVSSARLCSDHFTREHQLLATMVLSSINAIAGRLSRCFSSSTQFPSAPRVAIAVSIFRLAQTRAVLQQHFKWPHLFGTAAASSQTAISLLELRERLRDAAGSASNRLRLFRTPNDRSVKRACANQI